LVFTCIEYVKMTYEGSGHSIEGEDHSIKQLFYTLHTVTVQGLDTPTHSRVFLYLYYFLLCRIIAKTSKLWNNTYGIKQKSVEQIQIHYLSKVWGHLEVSLFWKKSTFSSIKITSNWLEIQCRHC
jgi:hypothetical protein